MYIYIHIHIDLDAYGICSTFLFWAWNDIIPCGPLLPSGQFATHQFCLDARRRGLGGRTFASLEYEVRIPQKLTSCNGCKGL